jgi:hypothetical protein
MQLEAFKYYYAPGTDTGVAVTLRRAIAATIVSAFRKSLRDHGQAAQGRMASLEECCEAVTRPDPFRKMSVRHVGGKNLLLLISIKLRWFFTAHFFDSSENRRLSTIPARIQKCRICIVHAEHFLHSASRSTA